MASIAMDVDTNTTTTVIDKKKNIFYEKNVYDKCFYEENYENISCEQKNMKNLFCENMFYDKNSKMFFLLLF